MKISLSWLNDVAFVAENETERCIVFDGAPEYGGKNSGMRPMEGLLSAAAACSAIDVVHILKKSRQPLRALNIEIKAERATTTPGVFTDIHLHFILGGDLSAAATKRAVALSVEKYCSALAMLQQNVNITHSHKIENQIADSANNLVSDAADNCKNFTDSTDSTNMTDCKRPSKTTANNIGNS